MPEHTPTVLVVDDEPRDADLIRDLLEEAGYYVLTAGNSSQALQRCRAARRPIDLLVTDVALPGKNGVDLFHELCTVCQHDLKVLFISAYSGSELLRSYGVPMTDLHFLPKPFSADQLLSRAREVLDSPERFPFGPVAQNRS